MLAALVLPLASFFEYMLTGQTERRADARTDTRPMLYDFYCTV